MNKKKILGYFCLLMIIFSFYISLTSLEAGFSDVDFQEPHQNYAETPIFTVNSTPSQDWKKTDVDFSGSIGDEGEFSLELSKSINLGGKMPGKLGAVEGSLDFGMKLGIRYNIEFGYLFGVDYYTWANDMAVSAGDTFSYLSYVEPDSEKFDLWATISIEPFIELWGGFSAYLKLAGYEIVDWDEDWSWSESLPFEIDPHIDLDVLLESGLLTPIGDLYSSPQIGLGIEIPDRLEFDVGFLDFYFDFGAGAYIQFQIKGLIENLIEIGGNAGAKIDGSKTKLEMKYYDPGKENLKSIDIHVPAHSVGKIIDIISQDFQYSVEPGILIGTEGHIDVGFHLHVPTPTAQVESVIEYIDDSCDWFPLGGWLCHKVTKTTKAMVDVVATICDDIDYDWDWSWSAEKEWWIPFFNIPLLESPATATDRLEVLQTKQHPISITQNWEKNVLNYSWEQSLGLSAVKLNAWAGYSLDFLLNGMMYTNYIKDDQIAGHPFNYYVGVDGDESGDGLFGGSFAAGYGLEVLIPYIDEWVELFGWQFNTSELSGRDLPIFEAEYTCGVAAISLSGGAEFNDLENLEIMQSANGFLGEWTTSPFLTIDISLDGKVFEVINMNLGSVQVDFLLKGTGDLMGNISASGNGAFDSNIMQWDKPGDINYANIYPNANSQKGDIIDILINNLKYNLDLDLIIRVSAKIYAQLGYLGFSHDFEIPITSSLQADVNEDIEEEIEVTKGFTPTKITQIPEEVIARKPFQIFWESANSSAGQTRIQYGKNPYPRQIYSDYTPFDSITTMGIASHNSTIILNKTGTWYFTTFLQSNNPPFNYYSKVFAVKVNPRLNFTNVPENATAGDSVSIDWEISGPSSVEFTNVLWSTSPNPTISSSESTAAQSGGAGTYSTQIKFDKVGTYYLIGQARVDKNETLYYTEIRSIKIIPDITINVLPTPNNASIDFEVNWTINGATHIDSTFLQYSPNPNFTGLIYSTQPQYGYVNEFQEKISIYTKGMWYLRVMAIVDAIDEVYYSQLPLNSTEIYPYTEINYGYPENVTAGESFKIDWWVWGFNNTVNKSQVFYDDDINVLDNPIGNTTIKLGNKTDYSDTLTINDADRYYFQANCSVDNEDKSWNSSIISILVKPYVNITYYPVNATAFTHFDINYSITGLNMTTTPIDLWFGETTNISEMTLLNQSVLGGTISAYIPETGLFYFVINLTFLGIEFWTEVFSVHLLPNIKIKIPWNDIPIAQTQVNPDLTPGQFAIAGIPVTFEWIISNTTTVNHTDIHFQAVPKLEPTLVPIVADYYKYDFTSYTLTTGWMTPEQTDGGKTYYVFRQNITFYTRKFDWVFFKIHARCDNKTFNYYSNSSGIAVYPAAEARHYNYSVVVDKLDIGINPKNFSVTWGMGYVIHNWTEGIVNNSPNYPGIVPEKVVGIQHANIHYCLNYDPLYSWQRYGVKSLNTMDRAGPALPGIFTDDITINSTGTYYYRIHVKYQYMTNNENYTYPQHINRSYWSPLYKIHVISFGKYNTTIKTSTVMPSPPPVEYADFDGDGDLDMLVGDNTLSIPKVILYFNDGTGNYTSIPPKEIDQTISTLEIRSIKSGYYNADNFLDFLMTNESISNPTTDTGYVFLNDGQCNFTTSYQVFNDKNEISSYTTGDLDHDGIYDYVYYDYLNGRLISDLGTDGGFAPDYDNQLFGYVEHLELSMMDENPDLDLVIKFTNGSLGIFLDYPTGSIRLVQNTSANSGSLIYPLVGDFNGDGHNDTIIVNNTGAIILTINSSTAWPINKIIAQSADPLPKGLASGDFDNDGDLDFVIGIGTGIFQFFFSNNSIGPYTFPGFSSCIASTGGTVIATGDFNLDGYLDISAFKSSYILHYLNDYIPPPELYNISVSNNSTTQTIDIENITTICNEDGVLNDTNTYVSLYTILNATYQMTNITGNLTWNGNTWEATGIDITSLPEGIYYINSTFGGVHSFGNNSLYSQKAANFTVDHFIDLYGINIDYQANETQKLNITVDIVNSTYTLLGDIKGLEAAIKSYIVCNSTGHNTNVTGNFTYSNTTNIYKWEAINVSTSILAPGDYFISVNFSDYLGYDSKIINSSIFTVDHTLISLTTPIVSYTGNLSQKVDLQNIRIKSTYDGIGDLGKGAARIYNYSVYFDNKTYTGLTGELEYDGFSWSAEIPVSSLPEGDYYINAFFKDKLNDTVMTLNSSSFTIDHIIDLQNLDVVYSGYMVQKFNVSISPKSTYDLNGLLDDSEVISSEYKVYNLNKSSIIETGNLTWNNNQWNKIIDVNRYLEDAYVVEIAFIDSYDSRSINSSILLPYHYIEISKPIFEYDFSALELSIINFTSNCSYHGIIDDTNVIPTNKSVRIVSDGSTLDLNGNFSYDSGYWQKMNIDLDILKFSNITVNFYFEVNESFGNVEYDLILNNGTNRVHISDEDSIEIEIDIDYPPKELKTILIKDPVAPDNNYPDVSNSTGIIYQIEVNDQSIEFNANISIKYLQADIDSKGLNEWLITIFTYTNGQWVEITDGFLDTEDNVVTVEVDHFSYFVVMQGVIGLDSDNDGLTDNIEVNTYGTDPNDWDSDNDGFSDGEEIEQGTDPNDPNDYPIQGGFPWLIIIIIVVVAVAVGITLFIILRKKPKKE